MEKIKRKIRLFLISYGRLFAFCIGIIFIVIFIIQSLNLMVVEENDNKYINEEYKETNKEYEEEDKEYISKFIDSCNEGEIEQAYEMLSEECKQEKYSTIEEFKKKYIDRVFSIRICKYKILKEGDIYIVTLTQDMIATGKKNSNIEENYRIQGVLERRIYMCD